MELLNNAYNEILSFLILTSPIFLKKTVLLVILYITYKPIKNICLRGFEKILKIKKLDPLLIHFLESIVNLLIYVFYLLNVIQILGIEMTSILAIIGSIGIGVGLALKGSLSDLAGGIQILVSRTFTKGDYISACGVEGIVQKITFLYTILFTVDNKQIVIPNGRLSGEVVVNYAFNKERRVDLVFSVSYETNIEKVKELIVDILKNHDLIIQEKDLFVRLGKHNSSSLDFNVRVWTLKENYWNVYFDLQELVKKRFDKEGIEIPYQKIDVYQK